MRKALYFIIILCVTATSAMLFAADPKDCPDCPKGPTATGVLDPNWKQFQAPPLAPGELPDCHRVQFGKQNCADCHMKETPAMYKQWVGSKHGLNSVKCGVCHGDVNNYRARPDKAVCIGCHSTQIQTMPTDARVTNCSFCHKSHWFTVHKIKLYEQFTPGRERRFHVPGF